MNLGELGHLTYCTNIHPGERWEEIRGNLDRHVARVKSKVAPDRSFGVGLRLGAAAASSLKQGELKELKRFLTERDLYVFTINGFPYGTFHRAAIKEQVYRPDWREPERVRYTNMLAEILAELLPDDLEGSISTVPGCFKPLCRTQETIREIASNIARSASVLVELERRTGKKLMLALEPEPFCMLETIEEAIEFFEKHLLATDLLPEAAMRRHVGICLDACHAAVEFEDPHGAVKRLRDAGITIAKVQLSAGLRVAEVDRTAAEAIAAFDEPVYLHQVVERSRTGLVRHRDLPDALEAKSEGPREWRIHFHVPIFLERLEHFDNTQSWLGELLEIHRKSPLSKHLEVETYTWDVLPEQYRRDDIDTAIARELQWVLRKLMP